MCVWKYRLLQELFIHSTYMKELHSWQVATMGSAYGLFNFISVHWDTWPLFPKPEQCEEKLHSLWWLTPVPQTEPHQSKPNIKQQKEESVALAGRGRGFRTVTHPHFNVIGSCASFYSPFVLCISWDFIQYFWNFIFNFRDVQLALTFQSPDPAD